MVGSTLAHYRIEAVLGSGGMGTVYRARDTELDRTVAIKVLSAGAGDARQQLLREARAASALAHSGIVTIHSIEHRDGVDFIVMEHVAGQSLIDAIPENGLPIETAIDYATQIAQALAAAHASGIVHRDIKPQNVMIGADGRVKVLDFGVARRLALDPADATRMATLHGTVAPTGAIVGTVGYLAPEQIAGDRAQPSSDVFSFGAVLYQMLIGRRPFDGDNMWAVMDATVRLDPPSILERRPDVPAALVRIVERCLAKRPEDRYPAGAELAAALQTLRAARQPAGARRWPVAITIAALLVAAAGVAAIVWARAREARRASVHAAVEDVSRRLDAGDTLGAFLVARAALAKAPDDPDVGGAMRAAGGRVPVITHPEGADVAFRAYGDPDAEWIQLGRTPLPPDALRPLCQLTWQITKPGYDPLIVAPTAPPYVFDLVRAGTTPDGMVHVAGGASEIETSSEVTLPAYWIDKYEVTNRAFKAFVDAGGYRTRKYWTVPIIADGREISWENAMGRFRDRTGRPGPSTWELGTYPEGQADYPVSGVSWYEAAAFAAFAGKSLPTVHHWYHASGAFGLFSDILNFSNFGAKGTAPVGQYHGLGPYGTYDMAGNVKEWCWNEASGGKRYVLGGAYNDANYQFHDQDARTPIERTDGFGFRCIREEGRGDASLRAPIASTERDPSTLKPVDDALFAAYRHRYDYDPTPLDVRQEVEESQADTRYFTRSRVSFRAAYGDARVPAEVFLPKNGHPPYQAVIYFPGSDAIAMRSSRSMWLQYVEFVVRSGRMVVWPVYQHTYERHMDPRPSGPNALREMLIQRALDFRRAVDYLQSRSDVDAKKVAGYGLSLGAQQMPLFLAVEPRIKTGVLLSGGFENYDIPPEADPVNFAPRVTQPVLMVNGREDFDLPYETAQVPLFQMLGTPPDQKRHVVLDGGHLPPKPLLVYKEILDWLDEYLGPAGT
ncbi:MAG TPA: protein kinase [Vicinamibacterales bacterium]|nr:protein kinase [Vicinamibacterales bacterium]